MSKNVAEVYAANPVTSIGNTDLFYTAAAGTTDAAFTGATLKAAVSPLTTKGDLYTFSTVNTRLAVGATNGQVLQVSSGAATGLAYSTATYPTIATSSGTILRANGTNWVASTSTFADTYAINSIPYASAANTITALAPALSSVLVSSAASTGVPIWSGSLTNGQMIIGSTGATPVVGTITASGNLTVTIGAGTLALSASGQAAGSFVVETTTSRTFTAFQSVITNNAGLVTVTVPATAAVGDEFEIVGLGAGGWIAQANTGQIINMGSSPTSSAGSLSSTNRYDAVKFVCVVANTTFVVQTVNGILTVA